MTYQDVATLISSIGLPYAYYQFPENDPNNPAPDPPFVCFYFSGSDDLLADDTNYQKIRPLVIELYTDNKDFTLEETVETALNSAGLVFSRSETYIDAEKLYMVTFNTEIVIS